MDRHTKRARRREAGFSFIELLVTIIIAAIAFAALVPLFVQAQTTISRDKARAIALNVAQDRMEKLRLLDFELVESGYLEGDGSYIGEFGDTWTEHTEGGGTKVFHVDYAVSEKTVSATDSRIAYKLVTVTVNWAGPPQPAKDVVLTTMLYRQYSGPTLVDFVIDPNDLALIDPTKPDSEKIVKSASVHLQATVDAADLASMRPRTVGSTTRTGRVDFSVTSITGTVYSTIKVPCTLDADVVFPATWAVPGNGVSDGYHTFKAVAYSAMGSPGPSWQLVYRVETGFPAGVGNLTGTAGPTEAFLTWNASITGDVTKYVIMRDGVELKTLKAAAGSMGYQDLGLTGPVGTTYKYTVSAVDWMGNSTATELSLTSVDAASVAPLPAGDLRGQTVDDKARLEWVASPSAGVLGYRVEQKIGAATNVFTTATATLDVTQGWGTPALYQVKPFWGGGVLAADYATLLLGQPSDTVDGVLWLSVTIDPERLYTLDITNTTNSTLTSLRLYYLGPAGATPQYEITPAAANMARKTTHTWSGLHAGRYTWGWVTANNKRGSQTAWCTGATLTIAGNTP